jgi:hypothetical protein
MAVEQSSKCHFPGGDSNHHGFEGAITMKKTLNVRKVTVLKSGGAGR